MSPTSATSPILSHSTCSLPPAIAGSFKYTLQSTTRQPLFIDPVAWTARHFTALQIKVLPNCTLHPQELPSGVHPPTLDEPSGFQDLLHPFDSRDLLDGSFSYTLIRAIRTCTFRRRHPLFCVDFEAVPIAFHFGSLYSLLNPQQIVYRKSTHCDIPFLAYNRRQGISQKRAMWQQRNRRYYGHRPRRIDSFFSAYDETPLEQPDPYDLAVLLALAQVQRSVVATEGSKAVYRVGIHHPRSLFALIFSMKTHVLTSSSLSPQLALFSADIPASFLDCLNNLDLPVKEAPVIHCYRVPVTADGGEFLRSLSSLLAMALADFPRDTVCQGKRQAVPADTDSNDEPKWQKKRLTGGRSGCQTLVDVH